MKLDHGGGYFDDGGYGGFNRSSRSDSYGDGVFAYEGGKVEPYGARGTAPKSSTWSGFDDYGRSISFPSGKEGSGASKIVKAVPKVDANEDVKSGVQKFRVKVLAESGGQSTMDVLCQVWMEIIASYYCVGFGLDFICLLNDNGTRNWTCIVW